MTIYCNREIIEAFKEIAFPKTKGELILAAENMPELSEASNIALNKLEEKTFKTLDEVCENVKIVCDIEIHDALKDLKFPATKKDILTHAGTKNCSLTVMETLDGLPDEIVYNTISDICR